MLLFRFCHNLRYCVFSQLFFVLFCSYLSSWVLSQFDVLSLVTIWVEFFSHNLSLSFLTFFFVNKMFCVNKNFKSFLVYFFCILSKENFVGEKKLWKKVFVENVFLWNSFLWIFLCKKCFFLFKKVFFGGDKFFFVIFFVGRNCHYCQYCQYCH